MPQVPQRDSGRDGSCPAQSCEPGSPPCLPDSYLFESPLPGRGVRRTLGPAGRGSHRRACAAGGSLGSRARAPPARPSSVLGRSPLGGTREEAREAPPRHSSPPPRQELSTLNSCNHTCRNHCPHFTERDTEARGKRHKDTARQPGKDMCQPGTRNLLSGEPDGVCVRGCTRLGEGGREDILTLSE